MAGPRRHARALEMSSTPDVGDLGLSADPAMARPMAAPWPNPAYAWYVVVVLLLCQICSFIDRQIVNLFLDPIREDLSLTDTQVSLVTGFAFAMFYATMGVPLARLA